MNKRTLRLRKDVLTALADDDLEVVNGAMQRAMLPDSFPTLCQQTCLTCDWTCLCLHQ